MVRFIHLHIHNQILSLDPCVQIVRFILFSDSETLFSRTVYLLKILFFLHSSIARKFSQLPACPRLMNLCPHSKMRY